MTRDDTGKYSIDEAVIDYLSKKVITDQTEKLVLARISIKMETSIPQVETSIKRLCEKHLIRKVSWEGKFGFELTPQGKSLIEVLAKAQTDRITRQLQEAIRNERKAKLRSSIVKKMKSNAERWQNYRVPDKKLINEIEQQAARFLAATKETESHQPLCCKDPQNYDQEFSQYKPQIEKLVEQNNSLNRAINNYAEIKNHLKSLTTDIEKINKTICKYEPIVEASIQINQLKTTLFLLRTIQSQLESFEKDKLIRFEELKTKLINNSRILENLKKTTHEFKPIRRESLTEKAIQYSDPEGPIKHEGKLGGYLLLEKCSNCGAKRKSAPVDIG
jgi:predicted transcriptional regulator